MLQEASFTRLLTEREVSQCNRLLCAAMTDRSIQECLIRQHDLSLFRDYGLPDDLSQWLHKIPRSSIPEFAQAIWNWQKRSYS
jgi:hypothetical protein